jgi:hypothetical protein
MHQVSHRQQPGSTNKIKTQHGRSKVKVVVLCCTAFDNPTCAPGQPAAACNAPTTAKQHIQEAKTAGEAKGKSEGAAVQVKVTHHAHEPSKQLPA